MKKTLIIFVLLFSYSFSKTIITVTYPFQEYFIKKIADNKVYIRTVFSKKYEFELTNKKIVRSLANSKYYFTLDLPEEKNIIDAFKLKNNELKIINLSKNIEFIKSNPYIWLDPILARDFAKNIYESLVKIRYYDREFFKENYEKFLLELDEIYLKIKAKINESDLYGFFAFNNNFDYFAKRFRIEIYHRENRRIFIDEIADLIRFSQKENIKHIVINKDSDYTIGQSFSGYINGKIIEVDIYDYNWQITLFKLVRGLTHFK